MVLCKLRDISKTYRMGDQEIKVLKGINLDINQGEFIAIMGPSGSGKTTLMNIMGCLDVATSGSYFLLGKDVSQLDDDTLSILRSEHIGFIFQNFYLLSYATVLENVLLPSLYVQRPREDPRKRALELLEIVGLQERANFKPSQLSGGQQQRVAIARALMNRPELLLADEPTGQLDSRTASEILEIIDEMNKRGTTVVLVTHDLNIAKMAHRIIHLHDGFLVG